MKKTIHNIETGEITEVDMTEEEIAEVEATQQQVAAEFELQQAESLVKAQAREALLDKLGITEEEAQLLLGGN